MRRGFTLIETLVYLALFSIVIGGLFLSAYAFFESIGRNESQAFIQQERDFLIAKIEWTLSGVNPLAANTYGLTLSVTKYDGTNVRMDVSSGKLRMSTNGGAWHALNNDDSTISSLRFLHTATAGINASEYVEVSFTMSMHTPSGGVLTRTASSTVYFQK